MKMGVAPATDAMRSLNPGIILSIGKAIAKLSMPPEQKPFRGTLDEFNAVFAGIGVS